MVDVRWHEHAVSRADRERAAGHRGCVLWFTGLSGSGKSTLANAVDRLLHDRGCRTFVLDGDNVRLGLNAAPALLRARYGEEAAVRFGLGFGPADRAENIRRVGAVADLFAQAGTIVLTAFVSPYRRDRDAVRAMLAPGDFVEIFVRAPLEVCERRDPKGLYKKARAGEIRNFTGIDDPYEEPQAPEIVVDSATRSPDALAAGVIGWLERAGTIPASGTQRAP
ncbi:MAG TPA: adenylyl-sulfate kinase [Planctomycetaceae bacterium]|nr:adenylyl-sulfate kinase [Planctomycetaceae bacterium]